MRSTRLRISTPLAIALAAGCGALALPLVAASPALAATPVTVTYTVAPGDQTFTVPAGVSSIHLGLVGGQGGDGNGPECAGEGLGGYAGYVSADVSVKPGELLHLYVGDGGHLTGGPGISGPGGVLSGGTGGSNGGGASLNGGGGGGASAVYAGATTAQDALLVAGGGGGGGGQGSTPFLCGGTGGWGGNPVPGDGGTSHESFGGPGPGGAGGQSILGLTGAPGGNADPVQLGGGGGGGGGGWDIVCTDGGTGASACSGGGAGGYAGSQDSGGSQAGGGGAGGGGGGGYSYAALTSGSVSSVAYGSAAGTGGTPGQISLTYTPVVPPLITSPASTSVTSASGFVGFDVTATGDPAPTFSLSGAPSWLGIDPVTGHLAGSFPYLTAGRFTFGIVASDGLVPPVTQQFTLTVTSPPIIGSAGIASATAGQKFTFPVTTIAYPTITAFSLSGAPSWLTINPTTGVISGTPPASSAASYAFTINATNGVDAPAAQTFTLTVAPPKHADLGLSLTTTKALVHGKAAAYRLTVSNHGTGATAGAVTLTDTLPSGLGFTKATGPGWTCTYATPAVTCHHAAKVTASATSTVTLTVHVQAPAHAVVTDAATVAPIDADPADNTASLQSVVG